MLGWVAIVLISLLSVQFCFVCLLASDAVKWTRCFWKDGDRTVVGPGGHDPEVMGNLSTVRGGRSWDRCRVSLLSSFQDCVFKKGRKNVRRL